MSKLGLCVVRQYVNQNDINSLRDDPTQMQSVNVLNKYIVVSLITITKYNVSSMTDVYLHKMWHHVSKTVRHGMLLPVSRYVL